MTPIDTYRDAFLRFMSEGMTAMDALAQFDPEEWKAAMWAEVELGEPRRYDPATFAWVTADGKPSLLDLQVLAGLEEAMLPDQQAIELWGAGWTSENPNPKYPCQTMSLYWRRPPKRAGKPGRRYLSTNQAWMALQREAKP